MTKGPGAFFGAFVRLETVYKLGQTP